MEKNSKSKKSRRARLAQLAQALVRCAGPDVYFAQSEVFQQINIVPPESAGGTCIVPEQLFILARVENYGLLTVPGAGKLQTKF